MADAGRGTAAILAKLLLLGRPREEAEAWLASPQIRALIAFRFAYIFAAHTTVLVPIIQATTSSKSPHVAMTSLGLASITAVLAEVPTGLVSDRRGPVVSLRRGLGLMSVTMAAFFLVGVWRAATLQETTTELWTPGVVAYFVLEIVMGVALSFINGADSVLFIRTVDRHLPASQSRSASEGIGSSVRYVGTMTAVGVGALAFGCVRLFVAEEATRMWCGGIVFLITLVAQILALRMLRQLDDPALRPTDDHVCAGWSGIDVFGGMRTLLVSLRMLCDDLATFRPLWIYCATLATGLFASYALQSPLWKLVAPLIDENGAWLLLWIPLAMLTPWASSVGGRSFHAAVVRRGRLETWSVRYAAIVFGAALLLLGLYVPLVQAAWRHANIRFAAALIITAGTLAFFAFMRGFLEPCARTALVMFAKDRQLSLPTTMISAFSATQRMLHFVVCLIYGLNFLPDASTTSEPGSPSMPAVAGGGMTLTAVLILVVVVAGLLVAQRLSTARPALRRSGLVVIGSYNQQFAQLFEFCDSLRERGAELLHPPRGAYATGADHGFVRLNTDASRNEGHVQRAVLQQIDRAHAVVVFCPDGRIGTSTALEIGYALSAGVRVVATHEPSDATLGRLLADEPNGIGAVALERMLSGVDPTRANST